MRCGETKKTLPLPTRSPESQMVRASEDRDGIDDEILAWALAWASVRIRLHSGMWGK